MAPRIYHVTTPAEFELAQRAGVHAPASLQAEGFIHCCFRGQLAGVLERYFRGAGPLVVLELDPRGVGPLRVEAPPGGSEGFPHVYAALPMAALLRTFALSEGAGGHVAPRELLEAAAQAERELAALRAAYAWYDHPEGPKFVETHRDEHRTSGHWLFEPRAISAFHRVLDSEELWLAQRGSLRLHVIDPSGVHREHALGLDLAAGERPVLSVPRGWLQAAELPAGEPFAFGANVCAPCFDFSRFELTPRVQLLARWPQHAELVLRLTHG